MAAFPGGFLGVEVFFVLSGFLITSLLLEQWQRTGGIGLRDFWLARARRLLPALFAVLLTVSLLSATLFREELGKLKAPLVGALTYTSNWYLVLSNKSYFEITGRPSALEHLWSLAVEEQFYLLWPLVLVFVLGRWGMRRLVGVTVVGIVVATTLMAVLHPVDGDPSRVYMGTDTRAGGLLVGALLAYAVAPGRLRATGKAVVTWAFSVLGGLALVGVLWFMTQVNAYEPGLWRGGFLALDVVTVLLIVAAVHPDAYPLWRTVLGNRVMLWVGSRSYGIYLWHWPIFVITRPRIDVPFDGAPLLVLRLALTFAIAEMSYRFLEMPIRTGALTRWWQGRRTLSPSERQRFRTQFAWGSAGTIAAAAVFAMVLTAAPSPTPATAAGGAPESITLSPGQGSDLAGDQGEGDQGGVDQGGVDQVEARPEGESGAEDADSPGEDESPVAASFDPLPASVGSVTAIGDSVMLGAAGQVHAMLGPDGAIDAHVARQWTQGIQVVAGMRQAGTLGESVVIHLGSNAAVSHAQVERMMAQLTGVRHVVLVTAYVNRPWADVTNASLRWAADRYSKIRIADWRAAAIRAPRDFMAEDGMHVSGARGAHLYASTIRTALVKASTYKSGK